MTLALLGGTDQHGTEAGLRNIRDIPGYNAPFHKTTYAFDFYLFFI